MSSPLLAQDSWADDWLRNESYPPESLRLSHQLDSLYQLLHRRGGVGTPRAAAEAMSKLLLIRIAAQCEPKALIEGYGSFVASVSPSAFAGKDGLRLAQAAFRTANSLPRFHSALPDGDSQAIWPADEPLGIDRRDVLAEFARALWGVGTEDEGRLDVLGTALDIFLRRRWMQAEEKGLFLTPGNVVDAMTKIGLGLLGRDGLNLQASHLVGDPCCGSGRFLLALLGGMERHMGCPINTIDERLVGADRSSSLVAMARVNLLASGLGQTRIYRVPDSITSPHLMMLRGRFALILTNPPFGNKQYDSPEGIARAVRLLPELAGSSRIDPALAFVALCADLLAPGGVMGIVLPDGVLAGTALSKALLGAPEALGCLVDGRATAPLSLEGIVSLPPQTFAPAGTTVKTSIVFARKGPRSTSSSVFLSRADQVGFVMRKGIPVQDPAGDDLAPIAHEVEQALRGQSASNDTARYVALEPLAQLRDLDTARFDESARAARQTLRDRGGTEARQILAHAGKRKGQRDGPFVSVLHVDEIGVIDWLAAERHDPATPGQTALPGQIIVSLLNPSTFRAAVIPEAVGPVRCSTEFGVFDAVINPYAALVLLQHPLVRAQAAPLGRGSSSSRRRISAEEVLALVLPPCTGDWVSGRDVRDRYDDIRRARKALRSHFASASGSSTTA